MNMHMHYDSNPLIHMISKKEKEIESNNPLQKDKEDLEEISTELELADEDELVP